MAGRHSKGLFSNMSFKGLFGGTGRHRGTAKRSRSSGPGRTVAGAVSDTYIPKAPSAPSSTRGRGRATAKYPGRTRGVSTRAQMQTRTGGKVHSGYGRFAGVRTFGWHTAPKMGG